jgi:hypothetical protein
MTQAEVVDEDPKIRVEKPKFASVSAAVLEGSSLVGWFASRFSSGPAEPWEEAQAGEGEVEG